MAKLDISYAKKNIKPGGSRLSLEPTTESSQATPTTSDGWLKTRSTVTEVGKAVYRGGAAPLTTGLDVAQATRTAAVNTALDERNVTDFDAYDDMRDKELRERIDARAFKWGKESLKEDFIASSIRGTTNFLQNAWDIALTKGLPKVDLVSAFRRNMNDSIDLLYKNDENKKAELKNRVSNEVNKITLWSNVYNEVMSAGEDNIKARITGDHEGAMSMRRAGVADPNSAIYDKNLSLGVNIVEGVAGVAANAAMGTGLARGLGLARSAASPFTLSFLAANAGANDFNEKFKSGVSLEEARASAFTTAMIEYATEKLPFDEILSPNKNRWISVFKVMLPEVPGEMLATAVENVIVSNTTDPNRKLSEGQLETFIVSVLASFVLGGGSVTQTQRQAVITEKLIEKGMPAKEATVMAKTLVESGVKPDDLADGAEKTLEYLSKEISKNKKALEEVKAKEQQKLQLQEQVKEGRVSEAQPIIRQPASNTPLLDILAEQQKVTREATMAQESTKVPETVQTPVKEKITPKKAKIKETSKTLEQAKQTKEFDGTNIVLKKKIIAKTGDEIAAKSVGNMTYISESKLQDTYENKAWTKPRKLSDGSKATPLELGQFKSYDEWAAFVLRHETIHKANPKTKQESLGEYEDRINKLALQKEVKEINQALKPKAKKKPIKKTESVKDKIMRTTKFSTPGVAGMVNFHTDQNTTKEDMRNEIEFWERWEGGEVEDTKPKNKVLKPKAVKTKKTADTLITENVLPVVIQDRITRDDLKARPHTQFLFGDNLQQKGLGGQAKEMRGEPNAFGIPTKKSPAMTKDAFFNDAEFEQNKIDIDKAFDKIDTKRPIVIPSAGLGTGLAKLQEKAPKTFEYLQTKLEDLKTDVDFNFNFYDTEEFMTGKEAPDEQAETKIVTNKGEYDVLGMRVGKKNMNTATKADYGKKDSGWLGNPYLANDILGGKGNVTREQAIELFRKDFYNKIKTDKDFKAAVDNLKGKKLGYYKPELANHLDVVIEYLEEVVYKTEKVEEGSLWYPPKDSVWDKERGMYIDFIDVGGKKMRFVGTRRQLPSNAPKTWFQETKEGNRIWMVRSPDYGTFTTRMNYIRWRSKVINNLTNTEVTPNTSQAEIEALTWQAIKDSQWRKVDKGIDAPDYRVTEDTSQFVPMEADIQLLLEEKRRAIRDWTQRKTKPLFLEQKAEASKYLQEDLDAAEKEGIPIEEYKAKQDIEELKKEMAENLLLIYTQAPKKMSQLLAGVGKGDDAPAAIPTGRLDETVVEAMDNNKFTKEEKDYFEATAKKDMTGLKLIAENRSAPQLYSMYQKGKNLVKNDGEFSRDSNATMYNFAFDVKEAYARNTKLKKSWDLVKEINEGLKDYTTLWTPIERKDKDGNVVPEYFKTASEHLKKNKFINAYAKALKAVMPEGTYNAKMIGTVYELFDRPAVRVPLREVLNERIFFVSPVYFEELNKKGEHFININGKSVKTSNISESSIQYNEFMNKGDKNSFKLTDDGLIVNLGTANLDTLYSDMFDLLIQEAAGIRVANNFVSDEAGGHQRDTLMEDAKVFKQGVKALLEIEAQVMDQTLKGRARRKAITSVEELSKPKKVKKAEDSIKEINKVIEGDELSFGDTVTVQAEPLVKTSIVDKAVQTPEISAENIKIIASIFKKVAQPQQRMNFATNLKDIVANINSVAVNEMNVNAKINLLNQLDGAIQILKESGMASEVEVNALAKAIIKNPQTSKINYAKTAIQRTGIILDKISSRETSRARVQKISQDFGIHMLLDPDKKFDQSIIRARLSEFLSTQERYNAGRGTKDWAVVAYGLKDKHDRYAIDVKRNSAEVIMPIFKKYGLESRDAQLKLTADYKAGKLATYPKEIRDLLETYRQQVDEALDGVNMALIDSGRADLVVKRKKNYVSNIDPNRMREINFEVEQQKLTGPEYIKFLSQALHQTGKSENQPFIEAWRNTLIAEDKFRVATSIETLTSNYINFYDKDSYLINEQDDKLAMKNKMPIRTIEMLKHQTAVLLGTPTAQQSMARSGDLKFQIAATALKNKTGIDITKYEWYKNARYTEKSLRSLKQVTAMTKLAWNFSLGVLDLADGIIKADTALEGVGIIDRKKYLAMGTLMTLADVGSKIIHDIQKKDYDKQSLLEDRGAIPSLQAYLINEDNGKKEKIWLEKFAEKVNVIQQYTEFFKRDLAYNVNYKALEKQGLETEAAKDLAAKRTGETMFMFGVNKQPMAQMGNPFTGMQYEFSGYALQFLNQAADWGMRLKGEDFMRKLIANQKNGTAMNYIDDFLKRKESQGIHYILNLLMLAMLKAGFDRDPEKDAKEKMLFSLKQIAAFAESGLFSMQMENLLSLFGPDTPTTKTKKLAGLLIPPSYDTLIHPFFIPENFKILPAYKNTVMIKKLIQGDMTIDTYNRQGNVVKKLDRTEAVNELFFNKTSAQAMANDDAWDRYNASFTKYTNMKKDIQKMIKNPNTNWEGVGEIVDRYNERTFKVLEELYEDKDITGVSIKDKIEKAFTSLIITADDIDEWIQINTENEMMKSQ